MRCSVALAAVVVLVACAPTAQAPVPAADAGAAPAPANAPPIVAPPARERVRVGYAALGAAFAAPWLAKDAGLFEKYGLDAELIYIPAGPTLIASMLAGELQLGESGAPATMAANLEGADLVWIAAPVNRALTLLVAPPEIGRIQDLRGRPVGVTRVGTLTHTILKVAVRAAGMEPDRDLQVIQTGGLPETLAALKSGRVEAGMLAHLQYLTAVREGMHAVADMAELGISWPTAGVITTRAAIAAQPERARNYVRAYVEALHILLTDRERGIAVIAKWTETPDRAIAEQARDYIVNYLAMPPYPDRAAIETVVREELLAVNPRAAEVPPEAYYDDRFVRELDESGFIRALTGR